MASETRNILFSVQKKVVIVTGTNSRLGIGRAAAVDFVSAGAEAIYLCDIDTSNLEVYKAELESSSPRTKVHIRQFDASDEESIQNVVQHALQTYKRLDIFFANAGIGGSTAGLRELELDDFAKILRLNTLSVFLAIKHAAPAMMQTSAAKREAGGSIIATASVAGIRSNAGPAAYSASKAAVISLVQTGAYELSGTGVRVNAICPGLIKTAMTARMFEDAREQNCDPPTGLLCPAKRHANSDEIAPVAVFLGSDASSYVNGQAWAVDGGLTAGHPFVPDMRF